MYTITYTWGNGNTATAEIADRDAAHAACREAKRGHVTKIIVHDPFDRWFVWFSTGQKWIQMIEQ